MSPARATDSPPPLWRAAVDTIRALSCSATAALFRREGRQWRLVWSDHITQVDATTPAALTPTHWRVLEVGACTALTEPRRVIVPGLVAGDLNGLLVMQPKRSAVATPSRYLPVLSELMAVGVEAMDEGTAHAARPAVLSAPDVSASASDELRALLEQQEWNVSRVARLLGVTRMTIYNRMRRLGVRRCKVRKSASRSAALPVARQADAGEVAHV